MKPFILFGLVVLFGQATSQTPQAPLPKLKHSIAVAAHRGGRGISAENTMAAFKNAVALGADYIETDIRATKDGKLVLMHDSTVDRTTNGKGAVKDLGFEEIRNLDAGSKYGKKYAGELVPTFEELLKYARGKINIYVDHKEAPTADMFAAIKKAGMEKHVVIYNSVEGLMEWKKIAPGLPVMPSLPNQFRKPGGISEFVKVFKPEVLDGNLVTWSKDLVDQSHAAGIKVYVDNLGPNDNEAGFQKAINIGVDGIQTDYPDRLIKFLKHERQ